MSQIDVFEQIAQQGRTQSVVEKRSRVRRLLMTGRAAAQAVGVVGFGRLFNFESPRARRRKFALRAVVGSCRHQADAMMYHRSK